MTTHSFRTSRTVVAACPAALAIVLTLFSTGCSHTRPYLRPGLTQTEAPPAAERIKTRFILLGDTGYLSAGDPMLQILNSKASEIPGVTTLLFLGNNTPANGFPAHGDPGLAQVARDLTLKTQIPATTKTKAVFIPGNDDWLNGSKGGYGSLQREQRFVSGQPGCSFVPLRGFPGPVNTNLDGVRLSIVNTEWWLAGAGERPQTSPEMALRELQATSGNSGELPWLIAAHHPLRSYGLRQGYFSWRHWLFPLTTWWRGAYLPLPVIYPVLRMLCLSSQDLYSPANCDLRRALTESLGRDKTWIYASGHEYGLQVIHEGKHYDLISGGGSPTRISSGSVWHGRDTEFAVLRPGFMVLDFTPDQKPFLSVIDGGNGRLLFSEYLIP